LVTINFIAKLFPSYYYKKILVIWSKYWNTREGSPVLSLCLRSRKNKQTSLDNQETVDW